MTILVKKFILWLIKLPKIIFILYILIKLFSYYISKVYVKKRRVSCLDMGPKHKICHGIYGINMSLKSKNNM